MTPESITKLAFMICFAGALLHLYTAMFRAEGGASASLVGLVLLSCLPYAIAAVLAVSRRSKVFGLGGAAASLLADIYMHYSVFLAPKGSTAALGLLSMPIWNLVAIGPAGAVLLWIGPSDDHANTLRPNSRFEKRSTSRLRLVSPPSSTRFLRIPPGRSL